MTVTAKNGLLYCSTLTNRRTIDKLLQQRGQAPAFICYYKSNGAKMAQQNTEPIGYISEIQLGDEKPVRCVYLFWSFFHKSKLISANCDRSKGNG